MKYVATVLVLGGVSAIALFCFTVLSFSGGGLKVRGPWETYVDIWLEERVQLESAASQQEAAQSAPEPE
ncbi:MAG: hypothetical protein WBA57_20900 [Elainellaceae cyanobacterium]